MVVPRQYKLKWVSTLPKMQRLLPTPTLWAPGKGSRCPVSEGTINKRAPLPVSVVQSVYTYMSTPHRLHPTVYTPLTKADILKIVEAVLSNLLTEDSDSTDDNQDNSHLAKDVVVW